MRLRIGQVAVLLDVAAWRIRYAHQKGDVPGLKLPKRPNQRLYYSRSDLRALAEFFDVDLPEEHEGAAAMPRQASATS